MRTPALFFTGKQFSELNTLVCVGSFLAEEFYLSNQGILSQTPAKMALDAFPHNTATSQVNVRLRDLESLSRAFQQQHILQNVIRCSDCVKDYFEWIEQFSGRVFSKPRDQDLMFFDGLANQVSVQRGELCPDDAYLTLDHLRLRRNCLVHRNSDTSAAFREICRNKGSSLNKYWTRRLKSRYQARVDFRVDDPGAVSLGSYVDIIRLARLCIEEFDRNYCKQLPDSELHAYLKDEFARTVDCSTVDGDRRRKRYVQFARSHFGWDLP